MSELLIPKPNEKQLLFLADQHKFIGYGGARGGGKSWAVRVKAALLCLNYPGIKVMIVRRTYPELQENHILPLCAMLRCLDDDPAEDYSFIRSLVTDNAALMASDPDYLRSLQALPDKLRRAWLDGDWDIYEGQFFEDFRLTPDLELARRRGFAADSDELRRQRRFTHVIEPFDLAAPACRGWTVFRSYDFGYGRPFFCAWWAVDYDGRLYRILEYYGCTAQPNQGLRLSPDEQFREIARMEREHPWLRGRSIDGVADPSIWDASRGESVAETAARYGLYFLPGDNHRVAGWMQCHYRLQFDEEGLPGMYVFEGCAAFLRTVPLLRFSAVRPEDVDTEQEDHAADEWRYACMSRPIAPRIELPAPARVWNPLEG